MPVVGQLDPSLSLLCTLVPGQQPKLLNAHTATVPVVFFGNKLTFASAVVVAVAIGSDVLVVTGQLDPASSLLLTAVPEQQPKALEPHKPVVVTTAAAVVK